MKLLYHRNPLHQEVLFEDEIVINIDIDLTNIAATSYSSISRFPGTDAFRQRVLKILEDEYGFDVIQSEHDGVFQKGYCSNRDGSVSIYFDTYFDLAKAAEPANRLGATISDLPKGTVYCFIHFRISDHYLHDSGDIAHRQFINNLKQQYTSHRTDVVDSYEEDIVIDEYTMQLHYDEAIEELKIALDTRILGWVRRAERFHQ